MYNILDRKENACAAAYMHWTDIIYDSITVEYDGITNEHVIKHEFHCPLSELLGNKYDKQIMETRSGDMTWALFLMYKKWIKLQKAKQSECRRNKDPLCRDFRWTCGLDEIEKYGRLLSLEERTGDTPLPQLDVIPKYRESWNRHMHDELLRRRRNNPWGCIDS